MPHMLHHVDRGQHRLIESANLHKKSHLLRSYSQPKLSQHEFSLKIELELHSSTAVVLPVLLKNTWETTVRQLLGGTPTTYWARAA